MGEAKRRGSYHARRAAAIERRKNALKPAPKTRKPNLALAAMLGVAASVGLLARRVSDPQGDE